jgi:hypothetical protein
MTYEHDRQCTYNVIFRRFRVTIVAVENQWTLHNLIMFICSPRYPTCNERATYYNLWHAPHYSIFPQFLIQGTIFEKFTEQKFVFWFSLQRSSETFLIPRRNERDMIKIVYCSSVFSDFNETFQQIFEKSSNIKFHELPSSGSRVVPCGRTDRHDEANSRFSQFCERA